MCIDEKSEVICHLINDRIHDLFDAIKACDGELCVHTIYGLMIGSLYLNMYQNMGLEDSFYVITDVQASTLKYHMDHNEHEEE